jgi:MFS family permease
MMNQTRSIWSPLKYGLFRALWISSTASHIGSYMTDVGQGWLMSSLTPSPLIVSLLLTAESLPFFLFGLPAGALADIVDRRHLLIVSQLAMAIAVGALALLTLADLVTPWLLLILAFVLGIATAFNDPAWQAAIPELVPKEELAGGITLSGVSVNVARTLGPAIGGFIVAAAGPTIVFVLDGLTFLGVIAVLLAWRRTSTPSTLPPEQVLPAIRAGLRFARHSPPLRRVLIATFLFMVCGAGVMALMPVLGRETGFGALGYGLLLGSLGVGAVTGGMLLSRFRSRLAPDKVVAAGFVAFAAAAIGAGALRDLFLLCPIMLIAGVAWLSVLSTCIVAVQQASPSWVRARVLAIYLMVFQAGIAGGSALWGEVASSAGLSEAYFGIAGGLVLGAAIALRLRPAAENVADFTPAHHWPEPEVAEELPLDAGPIMVQVEYCVDPSRAEAFQAAVTELGQLRRRDGAMQWWLFQDTADPSRFVESWLDATWADHLRSHERAPVAYQEIERTIRDLTRSGSTILTRHFVSPEARP